MYHYGLISQKPLVFNIFFISALWICSKGLWHNSFSDSGGPISFWIWMNFNYIERLPKPKVFAYSSGQNGAANTKNKPAAIKIYFRWKLDTEISREKIVKANNSLELQWLSNSPLTDYSPAYALFYRNKGNRKIVVFDIVY